MRLPFSMIGKPPPHSRQLSLRFGLLEWLSGLEFEFMIVSEIPRQNGFDGESRVVRGSFSPPRWFWRVF
jgi:hypothetical protein